MPHLSPPGWALAAISLITIFTQLLTLYDPSSFMADFEITSPPAVRLTAFLLILINGYDLLAALQDNWTLFRYSVVSRVVAAGLFWSLGPMWHGLVGVEVGTLVVLVGAMWVA